MTFLELLFYGFSAVLLFSALMVITSRYPVRAVLFLVLCFFVSAALWMILQAEFLALVLIFVYVGAVMTLFLFVVMMLNLDIAPKQKKWIKYMPLAMLVIGLLLVFMLKAFHPHYFSSENYPMLMQPENYSNVKELGQLLYTYYVYPFELAAALLLVAIIAAISLAFRGRHGSKAQSIAQQISVRRQDRVRLVKNLKSEP